MISKICNNLALFLGSVLMLMPAVFIGQESGRIQASSNELIVDGWRLIMPTVSVDQQTGQTWVKYDLPDGSYQSYPLDSGELIAEKWYKPGADGLNATPGGYSIEDTEEIKNWYMDGGKGDFVIQNGNWTAVADAADGAKPAASNAVADNANGASGDAENEAGPYGGGQIDPSAIQSVSTRPEVDTEITQLAADFQAARALCRSEPSNENCERANELQAKYLKKMQGD